MLKKTSLLLFVISILAVCKIEAQISITNIKKHIDILASEEFGGRLPQTKGDTLAANYIKSQFKAIEGVTLLADNGLQNITFTSREKEEINSFNVVAMIDSPNSDQHIVIGAHYDHLGIKNGELIPGADDNASGVGYIIELARHYAQQKEQLDYDIIFIAFSGEEMGLKGSNYYANNPIIPLKDCRAMINFDMLGRMINKGITIRGLGAAPESVPLFYSLENDDNLDIIWEFRTNGPTDYASFARKGVIAYSFSTRVHKDYHSPRDTPDKINYEGIEMASRYILQLLDKVLDKKLTKTLGK